MWRRGGRGPRAGRWPAERASWAGASPARGREGPRHAGSASALVPRALPLGGVGDGTGTPSRSVATPAPGLQRERTLALSATTGLSGQQGPLRGAAGARRVCSGRCLWPPRPDARGDPGAETRGSPGLRRGGESGRRDATRRANAWPPLDGREARRENGSENADAARRK